MLSEEARLVENEADNERERVGQLIPPPDAAS